MAVLYSCCFSITGSEWIPFYCNQSFSQNPRVTYEIQVCEGKLFFAKKKAKLILVWGTRIWCPNESRNSAKYPREAEIVNMSVMHTNDKSITFTDNYIKLHSWNLSTSENISTCTGELHVGASIPLMQNFESRTHFRMRGPRKTSISYIWKLAKNSFGGLKSTRNFVLNWNLTTHIAIRHMVIYLSVFG